MCIVGTQHNSIYYNGILYTVCRYNKRVVNRVWVFFFSCSPQIDFYRACHFGNIVCPKQRRVYDVLYSYSRYVIIICIIYTTGIDQKIAYHARPDTSESLFYSGSAAKPNVVIALLQYVQDSKSFLWRNENNMRLIYKADETSRSGETPRSGEV